MVLLLQLQGLQDWCNQKKTEQQTYIIKSLPYQLWIGKFLFLFYCPTHIHTTLQFLFKSKKNLHA
jgi:hypothetical protein